MAKKTVATKLILPTQDEVSRVISSSHKKYDDFEGQDPLTWAFPNVDPGIKPMGVRVLVQIRRPKLKVGSILMANDDIDAERWNTQTGKVIAIGPVAFRDRNDLKPWPEGGCKVGDFVRIPKYGRDQWEVPTGDGKDTSLNALFCLIDDNQISGLITVDPLSIKAYV